MLAASPETDGSRPQASLPRQSAFNSTPSTLQTATADRWRTGISSVSTPKCVPRSSPQSTPMRPTDRSRASERGLAGMAQRSGRVACNRPRTPEGNKAAREKAVSCERTAHQSRQGSRKGGSPAAKSKECRPATGRQRQFRLDTIHSSSPGHRHSGSLLVLCCNVEPVGSPLVKVEGSRRASTVGQGQGGRGFLASPACLGVVVPSDMLRGAA
jgi:hypothetical protein